MSDQKKLNEFQLHNASVSLSTLPTCSRANLARFNGMDKPQMYVALRGYIYDVSSNPDRYSVGKSYHKLVGKDISRLLGLNKLSLLAEETDGSPEWELTWDTTGLTDEQQAIVDKWVVYFQARYKIVGAVLDHVTN